MQADVFTAAVAVAQRVGHRNVTRRLVAQQLLLQRPELREHGADYITNWLGNNVNMTDLRERLAEGSHKLKLPAGDPEKRGQGRPDSVGHTPERIAENRQRVLNAGLLLAERHGYRNIKRDQVAAEAGVAAGLINRQIYWGSIDGFRDAVMVEAVRVGNLRVIAQGLVDGHPSTAGIDPELKEQAVRSVAC